jgi:hypothetical protein
MTTSSPHLTPDQLVDVAEGTRAETAAPHLAGCAACRQQLAELRDSMALLRDADVPEPSPLFWTQFSRRISETVAAEPPSRRGWLVSLQARVVVPVAVAAAVALFAVGLRPSAPPSASAPLTTAAVPDLPSSDAELEPDSSLDLVADLTAGIDLADAIDAGLASRDGAEHAVTHMNAVELAALQRLLTEAMARRGA